MTIQGGDIAAMVDDEVPSIAYALDIGLLGLDDNAVRCRHDIPLP